ncbi:MAG: peptidoglycan-binding protein [Luteolibacter sp.]|uniref:peptidoglycan-binding protein n=1 Tax=Luteolibacter sp. TaxID=1962973 RepID=UPI003267999C
MSERTGSTTGERNRNYLNVKNNRANPWQGSVGTDERGHTIFGSPEWGLRAAIMTLRTYWFSYGLRTIAGILNRWAPASDTIGTIAGAPQNNPSEYAAFVALRMRISAGQDLQLFHPDKRLNDVTNLKALVEAMAEFENYRGFDVPEMEFVKAVYLVDPDRSPKLEPVGGEIAPPLQPGAAAPLPPQTAVEPSWDSILPGLVPLLKQMSALELLQKIGAAESVNGLTQQDAPLQTPLKPSAPETPLTEGAPRAQPVGGFFVNDTLLRRIMQISGFALSPGDNLVFFGFRGALPAVSGTAYRDFSKEHLLNLTEVNYKNPRCTLGLWKPGEKTVALFPGSTIPTSRYVLSAMGRGGEGTNELLPGFYAFEKGVHRAGSPNGHEAFRQKGSRIFRRTKDDAVYEPEDGAQAGNPFDNLHAAFGDSINDNYSSAGCQVVVGQPKSENSSHETADWAVFKQTAYQTGQECFRYILFEAAAAAAIAGDLAKPANLNIRCGAEAAGLPENAKSFIEDAQKALNLENPDGHYGAKTALAVMNFQRETFGAREADGVLGPRTAEALKFPSWQQV